jgi:hypothetical protein
MELMLYASNPLLARPGLTLNRTTSDDQNTVASQARKLREEAIERSNCDARERLTRPAVDVQHDDISIRPQAAPWGMFVIMIFSAALIPVQVWTNSDSLFQQVGIPILLFLLSLASFVYLFLQPSEIVFCKDKQTVAITFRLGQLSGKNRTLAFAELKSIQSSFKITGDNDPRVSLELILKNTERLVLKTGLPDWSSSSPQLGFSGCIEPKEITALRQQIASLTGIENSGYIR